jgi:hypothetical protein
LEVFNLTGTLPVRAISLTKMRTISAVEVPSDLVTALALVSNGFSTRQRKSTVMLQLCHKTTVGQTNFFNTLPSRAMPLRMFSSLALPKRMCISEQTRRDFSF